MILDDFGPLVIVISRDEVEQQDISTPLATLKKLLRSPEIIRKFRERVDISFDGYNHTHEELFEIPDVRNYVYALDKEFPFWLYFLSREFLGLQCLAYCFLPPHLKEETRKQIHPERLMTLLENRWGPALFEICSAAGLTRAEADALAASAVEYFVSGRTKFQNSGQQSRIDKEDTDQHTANVFALDARQKFIRDCLEQACRAVVARPDQTPHSLLLGALFLNAVSRLPARVDQIPISLNLKIDHEQSWGMKTVTIGEDQLSFETTEAFDSGMGWDHESTVDWYVNNSHQAGLDLWVLEDVLRAFARDVGDPDCEAYFRTEFAHPFDKILNSPTAIDWDAAFPNKQA